MSTELERWKSIAGYLASCHAATLEGLPKRTAKHERARQVSICQKAAAFLRGTDEPSAKFNRPVEHEAERCEKAARNHAKP